MRMMMNLDSNLNTFFLFIPLTFMLNCCSTIERVSDRETESELPYLAYSEKPVKSYTKQEEGFQEYSSSNPAVKALLAQAKQQVQQGDLQAAELSLERALRISPRNAQVHFDLASVRLKQGNASSALQLALKGQSYTQEAQEASLFWRLIGDCHSALGNREKASEAYGHL